jgi:adenosine deaminase
MPVHFELHRHLGGAVVPRVFWRYLVRHDHPLARRFPDYEVFEDFVTRPRSSLTEYLELHAMVEGVQRLEMLPYFVSKLVRGVYIFENIEYLELRHTPYYRTDVTLDERDRIAQMADVVDLIARAAHSDEYPVQMPQILCMHSRLPFEVNRAIVDLAAERRDAVCGIDLAGPDTHYADRLDEWITLFRAARELGLKTTGHLFETVNGCHPELLPYLDRIGHGIQIPLRFPELLPEVAARGQCLEVCPTTYLKTGTLKSVYDLQPVFERCAREGVDIAIATDNAGLHNVRLPAEIETLLTEDVIDFDTFARCQAASRKHAFAYREPARAMVGSPGLGAG